MKNTKSRTRMIRWRLRVLMAEKKINNKTLAKLTGLHPTTISRLKNTDELKQVTGEVLNSLCNALVCTPNDLIEFTFDGDFSSEMSANYKTIDIRQHTAKSTRMTNKHNDMESAA
ncbi:MAG: helix-turn-helix domain-containing protein [Waterburya sp.]